MVSHPGKRQAGTHQEGCFHPPFAHPPPLHTSDEKTKVPRMHDSFPSWDPSPLWEGMLALSQRDPGLWVLRRVCRWAP